MSRFAKKRDANERGVIDALRAIGAVVTQIDNFGVPDLLVGYRGRTIMLEVKNPTGGHGKTKKGAGPVENAKGQLTECQVKWWSSWTGGECYVVETPEQAVALVKLGELSVGLAVKVENVGYGPDVMLDWMAWPDFPPYVVSPHEALTLAGALVEQAGVALATMCSLPPAGWRCSRGKGHEGPCAAHQTDDRGAFDGARRG